MLAIRSVAGEAPLGPMLPGQEIFAAEEFARYLELAKKSGGSIVVDPAMPSGLNAYFWPNPELVPENSWVIALRPDTNSSTFVHEWQHKLDRIDELDRYVNQLVTNRPRVPARTVLGRAAQATGEELEGHFVSELNATGKQFQLYFKTKRLPLGDALAP